MNTMLIAIATEVENAFIEDVGDRGYVEIEMTAGVVSLRFFIRDRRTLEHYKAAEADFHDRRNSGGRFEITWRCRERSAQWDSKWTRWFIYPLHDLNKAIYYLLGSMPVGSAHALQKPRRAIFS